MAVECWGRVAGRQDQVLPTLAFVDAGRTDIFERRLPGIRLSNFAPALALRGSTEYLSVPLQLQAEQLGPRMASEYAGR